MDGVVGWLSKHSLAGDGSTRHAKDGAGSDRQLSQYEQTDYLPFGEQVPANFRTGIGGYTIGDGVRQKFTQKERDNETALGYYGARYYSASQGRFTSTDPLPVTKESFLNPQRWNQFSYVNNSPLTAVDPGGRDGQGQGGDKVISVFLDLAQEDVGTRTNTINDKPVKGSTVPNFSDWQGTKKSASNGYQVNLYGPSYATGGKTPIGDSAQFEAALKSSEVVIYVAHGQGGPLPGTDQNPFRQSSITPALKSGGNVHYNSEGKWATGGKYQPKPDVSAKVVVNFSCDSSTPGGSYFNFTGQDQVMITIFSGTNGVTNADVLEKAAMLL